MTEEVMGRAGDPNDELIAPTEDVISSTENSTASTVSLKDSRRSWIVCFAGFLIQVLIVGILHVWGVFFLSICNEFNASRAEVSWVGSAGYGVTMLFGPLASGLIKKIGARKTAMMGTILCVIGILTSSFAESLTVMFLTFSLVFGLGCCFAYTPTMCITGDYFDKYMTVATGFMVAGSSTGTLILAPISQALIDSIGWRNAFRVLAAFACLTLWSGWQFVPLPGTPVNRPPEQTIKKSMARRLMADLRLWKNKAFVVWTLSITCVMFGYYIPYVHLVSYAETIGIPPEKGSILVMCLGASTATGRIMFGKIVKSGVMNRLHMHQLSMVVTGAASMLLPLIKSFPGLIIYVICVGLVDGCYVVLLPVMTSALVGADNTVLAWGFLIGTSSFTFTLGPPVAGWLFDSNGSYDVAFHIAGIPVILGAIALLLIPWAQRTSTSTNVMVAARPTYATLDELVVDDKTNEGDSLSDDDSNNGVVIERPGKFLIIELDEDSDRKLTVGACKLVNPIHQNLRGRRHRSISVSCPNEIPDYVVQNLDAMGALTPSMEKLAQARERAHEESHSVIPKPRKRTISEGSAPAYLSVQDPQLMRHVGVDDDVILDALSPTDDANSATNPWMQATSPPSIRSPHLILGTHSSSNSLFPSTHSLEPVPEEPSVTMTANINDVAIVTTTDATANNTQTPGNPFIVQREDSTRSSSSEGNSWDFVENESLFINQETKENDSSQDVTQI
ncbi:unnamed protein product [Owenia fusiformis]|uniref:Uncharacterized protein n=1 Tax=Owenia fusiformis TaxID=6347 RepID=A0A8J1TF15_OWEFU|nr:unnamed protein product [Owenia fusiformis]